MAWPANWRCSGQAGGGDARLRLGKPAGLGAPLRVEAFGGHGAHLLLEGRGVVSPSEARALAGALEEALPHLPPERRRWFRPS